MLPEMGERFAAETGIARGGEEGFDAGNALGFGEFLAVVGAGNSDLVDEVGEVHVKVKVMRFVPVFRHGG